MTELPRYKIDLGWDPVQHDDTLSIESDPSGDWVKWADVSSRLQQLDTLLKEIEEHCPCGARPESPATHPHVGGCPVAEALMLVKR